VKATCAIQVKLQSSDPILGRTIDAFNKAVNYASEVAWETKTLSNPLKLQKIVYRDLREQFKLRSQMACACCCRKVMSAYRSMRANGRMTKATFNRNSIDLNFPRDFRINDDLISITP
jgi:predicted transposase